MKAYKRKQSKQGQQISKNTGGKFQNLLLIMPILSQITSIIQVFRECRVGEPNLERSQGSS